MSKQIFWRILWIIFLGDSFICCIHSFFTNSPSEIKIFKGDMFPQSYANTLKLEESSLNSQGIFSNDLSSHATSTFLPYHCSISTC